MTGELGDQTMATDVRSLGRDDADDKRVRRASGEYLAGDADDGWMRALRTSIVHIWRRRRVGLWAT